MNISFVRRCQGDIRARAVLSEEDYRRINEEDRGEVNVKVQVEDESGNEPIKAEMIWAKAGRKPRKILKTSRNRKDKCGGSFIHFIFIYLVGIPY